MKRITTLLFLPFMLFAIFAVQSCGDDDPLIPPEGTPDYFPYAHGPIWTYKTNVFKKYIGPDVTMEMKIDTATYRDQLFDFLMIRAVPSIPNWSHVMGVLDSAGIIYSLGDHPREGEFPIFKHMYAENEITHETITVQGNSYETIKYTLNVEGNQYVTWWFVDGIGMVKEHSLTGVSIFSDDNKDEVLTELVSFVR